ncbi:uncharacterized protein LOC111076401 [Drosophila obscura]|uniref:uncharacterized protein LOC111076401 n=1 Tax=Drosophila obscura TaxID=7282 RepID=UPI000BA106C3|nr:uncharacterized protein LOC111076401 [Drosophila obscura]
MDNNPVSDSDLIDRKYSQASILMRSRRLKMTSDNEKSDGLNALIVPPIAEVESIANAVAQCNKPVCDDADMQCIMDLVDSTLCEALTIVQSDPRGLFCYKLPDTPKCAAAKVPTLVDILTNMEENGLATFATTVAVSDYGPSSGSSGLLRKQTTIGTFEYSTVLSEIQDFIGQWQLSPDTKCAVLSNPIQHDIPIKGKIYFVDAHFSRPTPRCPNPLAVAKVRFIITVSKVLQKHYPVMITYRFEGYNTLYYAVGERSLSSLTFQRFYIDTILHTKLAFYAEVCECRHGTVEKPKKSKKGKT